MRLPCPSCGALHLDVDEFATKVHHTHACQECGMVWCPAVVATVGVRFLLRCVLDGWGADVDDSGHALIFNPGGTITARRRIAEHQAGVFWRAYGQEPRP